MEKENYGKIIEDQGFVITYNPPGGCQFAAFAQYVKWSGHLKVS